jgi:aspartyl-tRNA(Asn)/glutamyl-tRNA(Gln) amidotransferase subunit C
MQKPEIDIRALASLARLDVSDAEVAKLEKEIPAILAFVEEIQSANVSAEVQSPALRNVVRADENPHGTGEYTERILKAAPATKGDRVVVKQVVSRKKH